MSTQPHSATRRRFLKSAAAIAAVTSLPAFSADTPNPTRPPVKPKPPTPGEGLSIGLIGCGGQGTGDAMNATRLGAKIVAICDVDESHLANAKKNWPQADEYSSFLDLVQQKNIDAVICGTPDHWHTFVSIAAMRAGKDVYCEKPLTLTIDEGKHLVKVQRETNRVLQTGTQQRSTTGFRLAAELVRAGVLGKLKEVNVWVPAGLREGPFKVTEVPKEFDYDTWLGQTPEVPYIKERTHLKFRYWWNYSAGTITDWGAHHNDIVLWALGKDRSGPVSAEGKILVQPIPGGFTVPSEYEIEYTYDNGLKHTCKSTTASSWSGQTVDPKGQLHGIRFIGENGGIWVTRGTLDASDRNLLKTKLPDDKRLYFSNDHMGNFLDCVKSRKAPICEAEIGHRSASLCHLGAISVRLGRKINWDPAKEEFINDPEATTYLSREMRKPWDYSAV